MKGVVGSVNTPWLMFYQGGPGAPVGTYATVTHSDTPGFDENSVRSLLDNRHMSVDTSGCECNPVKYPAACIY